MKADPTRPGPYEVLGLLASADRQTIERRAEALTALLKLGLAPPEGDAVRLPEGQGRDAESVVEAARALRDPRRWLLESLLWPDGRTARDALGIAADLLEGAAGRPTEPASLVRHLALEYLAESVGPAQPVGPPDERLESLLAPPARPPLYVGAAVAARADGAKPDGE